MKIFYEEWNPKLATLQLVHQANEIIDDYRSNGYTLTLRQLYYQFVAKGVIDNSERSYKNLGNMVTRARMAGMISWEAIEDRNRQHQSFWSDEDIMKQIRDLPYGIRYDFWHRQEYYVEVWVEKEALGNVVHRACSEHLVPHLSCKGYLSASEAWRAGRRFQSMIDMDKKCVLIHLGDHDPSGIDMTRDNRDRLDIFTECPGEVKVTRLALNMDQVEEYSPPPNPAKLTDSRIKDYIKRYGETSWELDALEPQVMEKMIKDEISQYIDDDVWFKTEQEQEQARQILRNVSDRWSEIAPIVERD